ncbi:MAG: transglycosylase domain-containing protein [Alistipes indistinctus]
MYLNTVEYGSNAYGIKSAARTFFNKLPSELNAQEAAMLVGVVNAPTRYSPAQQSRPGARKAQHWSSAADEGERTYLTARQRDSIAGAAYRAGLPHPISHNAGTGTYFREMLRMVMTSGKARRARASVPGAAGDWDYRSGRRAVGKQPACMAGATRT